MHQAPGLKQRQSDEQLSHVNINVDVLTKEMQCAICLNEIEDCGITKCGHVFCRRCIDEVINRHHRCPNCNAELRDTNQDVFTNFHFNSLKKTIKEERDKAVHNQLNKVFPVVHDQEIQELFRNHLKNLYLLYQNKFLEAQDDYEQKVAQLTKEHKSKLENAGDNAPRIEKEYAEAVWLQKSQYDTIRTFYLDGAKRNLQSIQIDPAMLDVRATVVVPAKNFRVESIFFKPQKTIASIWSDVAELFGRNNNPVLETENLQLLIVPMEHYRAIDEYFAKFKEPNAVQLQTLQNMLPIKVFGLGSLQMISTLEVKPGSIFYVVGQIKCRSDLPAECLTYAFQNEIVTDYFSCEQCKINWICPSCREYCHKDHNTQPYLKNHKATWACCYCVSKGKCKALNKNNKPQ